MGLFGNIMDKIFKQSAERPPDAAPVGRPVQSRAAAANQGPGAAATPAGNVDVEKILDEMKAKNPQKLDWRHSIVDLMKLVGMDSSLSERRELADELGYKGDKDDTATMNMWLHKQVMKKLQENGGRVPQDLLD